MSADIPFRYFYSIDEAMQLRGCGRSYIYEQIAEGTKRFPGPDAILPDQLRPVGRKQTIHRSWVCGEPRNLSPMRTRGVTPDEIETAVERVLDRMVSRFLSGVAERKVS